MEMTTKVAKPCSRCEVLPARSEGEGTLYLWFPLGHTFAKAAGFLRGCAPATRLSPGEALAVVPIDAGGREALIEGLAGVLGPEEQADTKALFRQDPGEPTLADFAKVTSLAQFLRAQASNWLVDLLAEERFTSCFQPIFHAADSRRVFAHEALFRGFGTDGQLIAPARIFQTGAEAGLLFQLDLQARRSAIRQAVRQGVDSCVFINFNPSAIYDPAFCLQATLRAVDEAGMPRERVVFEVVESDHVKNLDHLARILGFYREMGFRVALDDLGAGYSSLNLIHQLKPDFIKLDMELVRGVGADAYKAAITGKILELAQGLGIETIAEGIETDDECAWLVAHGATYLQGYLLGRPSPEPFATRAAV